LIFKIEEPSIAFNDESSNMQFKNVLVTGPPGCGKTTLLEKLIKVLPRPVSGFITRELRGAGKRVGFSIEAINGNSAILAHLDMRTPFRVGKYGVRIETVDQIAIPSLLDVAAEAVLVVDEIGRMECFSALFRKTIIQALDSEHIVLGSIARKGGPFIQQIRTRKDILLVEVNSGNRNELVDSLPGIIGLAS
jgi:nucleoside-triphosphatase